MAQVDAAVDETRSFMKSRVILTAVELDLFTRLDEKSCNASELARDKQLDVRATTRVLDCLVAFGLLEKDGGAYKLTEKGSLYSAHHPETIRPMVLHMNHLWNTWSELTDVVKNGGDSKAGSGLQLDPENWKSFIGAMHVSGRTLAQKVASEYDLTRFKRLLDVGGASGTYTIAFLHRNPAMTAVLFDLENVIPMAKERLAEEKIDDRVDLVAGDFYRDELPKGCDLALVSAIIHQNSPEENLELYSKIYRALEPGGAVLIRDHIMDESRTKPLAGAVFAVNMLVNRRGGDTYTFAEVKVGLEKAGFVDVKQLHYGESMDSLVEGRKRYLS
jgi:SAM-dependent methyltransferase/predicted transcriptional regulator